MAGLLKWYLACLKKSPMIANGMTAMVMMTSGDVVAQEIELAEEAKQSQQQQQQQQQQRQQYDPQQTTARERSQHHEATKHHSNSFGFFNALVADGEHKRIRRERTADGRPQEDQNYGRPTNMERCPHEIDYSRSAMMAGWALCFLTPFYVTLFQWYEKNLPTNRTLAGVFSRVGMSFVTSVPVNLVFFAYGCLVYHTADWTVHLWQQCSLRSEASLLKGHQNHVKHESLSQALELLRVSTILATSSAVQDSRAYVPVDDDLPAFDWEAAWSKIVQKWREEMLYTTQASASFWIPFNSINFSLVPVHLRPLTQCGAGVGWNCFLSLAQHRSS